MNYDTYDAASAGMSAGTLFFWIIVSAFYIFCFWKIFAKAGEPGWASIVPLYRDYVLFKIVYGNGLKFLLLLVPIVNIFYAVIINYKLAKTFSSGDGFAVLTFFFPEICIPILAFGKAEYMGPLN